MNKKLNFINLKMERKTFRKRAYYVAFTLIFIGQLSIAFILFQNDKAIQENGKLYRIKLDSLEVSFDDKKATVEFHKSQNITNETEKIGNLSYEINELEGFYYNVEKDKYNKAYLVDTDLNRRKEYDYLQEKKGVKNHFTVPEFYIEGDKLKTMKTGNFGRLGFLSLEADVLVYKGAYIIQEIYINRVPYEEYIDDNYFELLELE